MKCPNNQTKTPDNQKFCGECGAQLVKGGRKNDRN